MKKGKLIFFFINLHTSSWFNSNFFFSSDAWSHTCFINSQKTHQSFSRTIPTSKYIHYIQSIFAAKKNYYFRFCRLMQKNNITRLSPKIWFCFWLCTKNNICARAKQSMARAEKPPSARRTSDPKLLINGWGGGIGLVCLLQMNMRWTRFCLFSILWFWMATDWLAAAQCAHFLTRKILDLFVKIFNYFFLFYLFLLLLLFIFIFFSSGCVCGDGKPKKNVFIINHLQQSTHIARQNALNRR